MATLGQLETDVRDHLDESLARQWSDGMLRRWILEGAREVARRAETLQDMAVLPVVSGTSEYTVAADTLRIYRVTFKPGSGSWEIPLEYKDFNSMDSMGWQVDSWESMPEIYTLWGFTPNLKIKLYPTPSEAGDLEVWYYRLPTTLSEDGSDDAEQVDIPNGWQDLIVLYCEYVALRRDADGRWQEAKQLFESRLGEHVDMTRRFTDQAGSMEWRGRSLPGWLYGGDAY